MHIITNFAFNPGHILIGSKEYKTNETDNNY